MTMPLQLIRAGSFYKGRTGDVREVTRKGFSTLSWRSTTNQDWWATNYPCEVFASWADEEVQPK
jgi:hypothetical protein